MDCEIKINVKDIPEAKEIAPYRYMVVRLSNGEFTYHGADNILAKCKMIEKGYASSLNQLFTIENPYYNDVLTMLKHRSFS